MEWAKLRASYTVAVTVFRIPADDESFSILPVIWILSDAERWFGITRAGLETGSVKRLRPVGDRIPESPIPGPDSVLGE